MADNNPFPGENNTGHIWDDNIRELDNPPPRWWMIAFWASLLWWVGYAILYPMWPVGQEPTKGVMGWTAMKEYKEGLAEVAKVRGPYEEKINSMSAKQILADPGLADYTVASAKVLFGDNCAACHGSGGQGNPGFPVLADDDWLYGGDIGTIQQTITMGRQGMMPAKGGSDLTAAEIDELANAIVQGKPKSTPLFTSKGCIGCHGVDGKGMHPLGSANLTDGIFRFLPEGNETQLDSIKRTITHGVNFPGDKQTRQAQMPTFGGGNSKLSKDEIKKLAVYVYKLGGGQASQ